MADIVRNGRTRPDAFRQLRHAVPVSRRLCLHKRPQADKKPVAPRRRANHLPQGQRHIAGRHNSAVAVRLAAVAIHGKNRTRCHAQGRLHIFPAVQHRHGGMVQKHNRIYGAIHARLRCGGRHRPPAGHLVLSVPLRRLHDRCLQTPHGSCRALDRQDTTLPIIWR